MRPTNASTSPYPSLQKRGIEECLYHGSSPGHARALGEAREKQQHEMPPLQLQKITTLDPRLKMSRMTEGGDRPSQENQGRKVGGEYFYPGSSPGHALSLGGARGKQRHEMPPLQRQKITTLDPRLDPRLRMSGTSVEDDRRGKAEKPKGRHCPTKTSSSPVEGVG